MHELGVVMEMLEVLDEIKVENNLTEVESITVEVGELCGIIPDYFKECWKVARISTSFENTDMKLNLIKAKARCSCSNEFFLTENGRKCPKCQQRDYEIIDGKQFEILEISAK